MIKLSEGKDTIFRYLHQPGAAAEKYYNSSEYIKCPEDISKGEYDLFLSFDGWDYYDCYEEYITELSQEVGDSPALKSLCLENLRYIEHSYLNHFLKYEPFNNDKQRFDNISDQVTDFLDFYLLEVGRFLYFSRNLIKKFVEPVFFMEFTIFEEVNGPGESVYLEPKKNMVDKQTKTKRKKSDTSLKLQDIFIKNGERIVQRLETQHGGFQIRKEPKFWTKFLCCAYENDLLKKYNNKELVFAINNTFQQNLKQNNITPFSKFKKGEWEYAQEYSFSFD